MELFGHVLEVDLGVGGVDSPQARFDDILRQPRNQGEISIVLEPLSVVLFHDLRELFEVAIVDRFADLEVGEERFLENFLGEGVFVGDLAEEELHHDGELLS